MSGTLPNPWPDARPPRWAPVAALRHLGLAVAILVVAMTALANPRPGLDGRGLAVLVALVCFAASAIVSLGLPRLRRGPSWLGPSTLILWTASSIALVGLQPAGPAWLGVFTAVGASVMRLPARLALWLYLIALAALATQLGIDGARKSSIVLSVIGASVFVVLSSAVVRLREAHSEQERLIAELEETREAQAQAAALSERGRLAREMHDVLAHSLSGLVLQLEGVRLLTSQRGADPEVGRAVDRAHRLARAGLEEARRAIGMLRDDELPGPERLEALAAEFERDVGVPVRLHVSGHERELASEARLAVFRTAQEALTNVRKHAHAERVDVHLTYEPDGTRLVVEDVSQEVNGSGSLGELGAGYGLTGMSERAELIGGRLVAASIPGGFRVELWVPA